MMVEFFTGDLELARKKAVFDALDAADGEDDYDEERNEVALFLRTAKAVESHESPPDQPSPPSHFDPEKSFSLKLHSFGVDPKSSDRQPSNSSPAMAQSADAPVEPAVESAIERTQSKRGRKRKRNQMHGVPEANKIFKGLIFYFFPNNDVAPARRVRIHKAVERGALWEKEWKSTVTHVVVDKELSYDDVLKYLRIPSMPAHVVIVNEGYPSSCITFGYLIDLSLIQHRVRGQIQSKPAQKSPVPPRTPLQYEGKAVEVQTPQKDDKDAEEYEINFSQSIINGRASSLPAAKTIKELKLLSEDSLEAAIEEAKAVQGLEDMSGPSSSRSSPEPSGEVQPDVGRISSKAYSDPSNSNPPWQETFHCMRSSATKNSNANARTIEVLQQMATHYDSVNDHWRTVAYRKAISALRTHPTRVSTKAEALALKTIGERLADKIEEIVQTDNLRFLQNAVEDPGTKALRLFLGIYQVGSIQASAWVAQGYRTLDDLVTNHVELTPNQRIGLEHYEHFNQRIPRPEMDGHTSFVKKMIERVENTIEVTIGGSYRRGVKDSGDIDFIIASPQNMSIGTLRTIFFDSIVPRLYAAEYLKCALAATNAMSDSSKWHGACALPTTTTTTTDISPWRRIDFLLVPYAELGAVMLYFTDNDLFNRSMRLLARRKGMRLNQRGLWKGVEGGAGRKGGEGGKGGVLVAARSERAIFDALGVQWREADERNV